MAVCQRGFASRNSFKYISKEFASRESFFFFFFSHQSVTNGKNHEWMQSSERTNCGVLFNLRELNVNLKAFDLKIAELFFLLVDLWRRFLSFHCLCVTILQASGNTEMTTFWQRLRSFNKAGLCKIFLGMIVQLQEERKKMFALHVHLPTGYSRTSHLWPTIPLCSAEATSPYLGLGSTHCSGNWCKL